VQPDIDIKFGQNYLLDGALTVNPPTISIKGPQEEISNIDHLTTQKTELDEVTENFSKVIPLQHSEGLEHTTFSSATVTISGKVFKFSEKIIKIPVDVVNVPEGTEIKTFPGDISVLCKGRIENLKKLGVSDFKITADFNTARENSPYLEVKLSHIPEHIHSTQLMENQVEFILKRK
jgi:YbbR domain-containing protein